MNKKQTNKPLRLFVWKTVLESYGYGTAFALAEDIQQARELLESEYTGKKNTKDWTEIWEKMPDVYDSPFCYFQWGSA